MANVRIVDPANVQALVYKVMERRQLKVKEITDMKKAVVVVHGKGQFDCTDCLYKWNSHFSWIRIDLKDMLINYRWKMKCKNCAPHRNHKVYSPTFSLEEMEKMIERAICAYKGERYVPPHREGERYSFDRRLFNYKPPHIPELCEKCGWGQVQCWTLPAYSLFLR